mmetsp:Transcript_65495/g.116548  ORF Transcript_65495/g.116548 Transcript_65495/m.116548 type:complete len:86 (+) Transcript_65495:1120-1377(+)
MDPPFDPSLAPTTGPSQHLIPQTSLVPPTEAAQAMAKAALPRSKMKHGSCSDAYQTSPYDDDGAASALRCSQAEYQPGLGSMGPH